MDMVRPRMLMLAALLAIFPLMLSFMPLTTALIEWHVSLLAVSCAIVGLGISGLVLAFPGLVLAFRRGSLLVLGLFWIALGGVAVWIYPDVGPENDEIDTFLYASSCIYLVAGLGLTLASRQVASPVSSL